jgi:N6-L-threonylcarbamoyladenine synthase
MLREKMNTLARKRRKELFIPHPVYCTDNAAMIAVTGYFKAQQGQFDSIALEPFASIHV